MTSWNRLRLRLKSIVHKDELDDQLSGELDFHLAEQKAELMAAGMSESEADLEARRLFGPVTSLREECRDTRRTQLLEDFIFDVKHTLRTLRQSPAFTIVAIFTLALGIGANAAFFSTAYGILFRALPYPNPQQLVVVESGIGGIGAVINLSQLSKAVDYAGYDSGTDFNHPVLKQIPVIPGRHGTYGWTESSNIRGVTTTYNLPRVLGVQPFLGRWFSEADERPNARAVAILSYCTWRDRFDSDPTIIGYQLKVNAYVYRVVGVMPPGLDFPTPQTEFWIPIRNDPTQVGDMWGGGNFFPIGRLHPASTLASAQAEMPPIIARILPMFPWRMPDAWGKSSTVIRLDESLASGVRPKLLALSVAALMLLLIACGNVGNLLLARGIQREREFALREALGANPARLLRQAITENLVLVMFGGLVGLIAALAIFESLPLLFPGNTPRLGEFLEDPTVAFGVSATLLLTFLLFTVAPLMRSPLQKVSLAGRALTATTHASHASLLLIGVELAFVTTLLIGAGLMGRTLWQLATVDTGTNAGKIAVVRFLIGPWSCRDNAACLALLDSLSSTLLTFPTARNVAWTNLAPLELESSVAASTIEDHPESLGKSVSNLWQVNVTPGYFQLLKIPLRQGRYFTEDDQPATQLVTIISESTARRYWPNQNPIGKHIKPISGGEWLTVVGVVGDVAQYSVAGFPAWIDGVHYRPFAQTMPAGQQEIRFTALVESGRSTDELFNYLRFYQGQRVNPRIQTIAQIRSESIADHRSTATLIALLAALGLTLGIAGVYGVVSHRAAQRTKDVGVRLALGATATQVVRMVMKETILVSLLGVAVGIAGAYALSPYLQTLIFGISTHDALAFTLGPLVLLLVATVAAVIPAWRATRINPSAIIRED